MVKAIESYETRMTWITMNRRMVAQVFLGGLGVGLLTYALFVVLKSYVFSMILCRDDIALARCDAVPDFASGTALLIGSLAGLFMLVRERAYRPILALIGVVAGLWGLFDVVSMLPWYVALVIVSIVFGVAYVLFTWLVQPRNLWVSLGMVILSVVALKLALGA